MVYFNIFAKLGTRENHLQRWCENPCYLRSKKKKRYVFIFISNLTYFIRGVNFSALFSAAKTVLFGPAPGSRWQSVVQFPELSDEAGFQVPTWTTCNDGALYFCQPGSSPVSHNSYIILCKCFLSFSSNVSIQTSATGIKDGSSEDLPQILMKIMSLCETTSVLTNYNRV